MFEKIPLLKPLAALVFLILLDTIIIPGFIRMEVKDGQLYGSVIDILNRAAPLIITSLGLTLVIATRGIDISVGAVAAISGTVAVLLFSETISDNVSALHFTAKSPLFWAIFFAIGCAILCGIWNGLLVIALGLQPIIATMILMVGGRGLAQLLTDGQIQSVAYQPFFFLGSGYFLGLPFSLYIVAVVFVALILLIRKTALGLFIQTIGINPVAARLVGIRAALLIVFAYVLCSLCAGLAGVLICSNIKSADANNIGLLLELDAILAVTLGGTSLDGGKFSLVGSVIGALIIQTLTYTIYSLGAAPELNMIIKAIVVVVVCVSQSSELKPIWCEVRSLFNAAPVKKSASTRL